MKNNFVINKRLFAFTVLTLRLLLLIASPLPAPDSLNLNYPLPEMTEFYFDIAELQNWIPSIDSLDSGYRFESSSLEARLNLIPYSNQITNRLLFSFEHKSDHGQARLTGVCYQKLKQAENPINRYQIGLINTYKRPGLTVAMGSFRLQAGEGMCLGKYQNSGNKYSEVIYPAQGLSHPALTGAAGSYGLMNTSLAIWLSQTQRLAKISDDKIETLYESSLSSGIDKDYIPENTGGLIISQRILKHNLGTYYYHQSYNSAFGDNKSDKRQDIYGIFCQLLNKPFTLGFETFKAKDNYARAIRFEHQINKLSQSMKYFYRPDIFPLSYAKTQQVFGQYQGCEELSWDIRYHLSTYLTFTGRMAVNKDLTGQTDTEWKEREILSALWHNQVRQIALTYYRYRKDAILASDSLNADILPVQNRIRATWKQQIINNLTYGLTGQYQHYTDKNLDRNGITFTQSVDYSGNRFHCHASFIIWSNQKSLYQNTELTDNDDYLAQTESDSAIKVNIKYRPVTRLNLNLQAYIPIKHTEHQSYNCSLAMEF